MFIIECDLFTRKGSAIRHVFHSTSPARGIQQSAAIEHAGRTINQYKSFTWEDTRKLLRWHLIDIFDLYKKKIVQ